MSAVLHVIAGPLPGQLATIAHPRADAWPAEQLSALARTGVEVLVSALTETEQQRLGLDGTRAAAAAVGLEFLPFPTPEGPGFPKPPEGPGISRSTAEGSALRGEAARVIELAGRLAAQVHDGRFVVTQCFGGVGRSTLLVCTTLVLLGVPPGEALRRSGIGSGTPVTRDWLHSLVAQHAAV